MFMEVSGINPVFCQLEDYYAQDQAFCPYREVSFSLEVKIYY